MSPPPKVVIDQTSHDTEVPVGESGISGLKLALGAASLFFFLVGVKKSFRTDDGVEILKSDADRLDEKRSRSIRDVRDDAARRPFRPEARRSREKASSTPRSDVLRSARAQLMRGLRRESREPASTHEAGRRKG